MIATAAVLYTPAAPPAYVIADKVSRKLFNPTTGQWEATATPLAPADWQRLAVRAGAGPFASLTTWPAPNYALLWANVGDDLPGDQLVAIPFGVKADGTVYETAGPPLLLDLSPVGRTDGNGWVIEPAPGVGTTAPTVPGATPTTPTAS